MSKNTDPADLWLANCYFAHNSLRFPALLCSVRPAYHFIVLSTRIMSEVHGCGVTREETRDVLLPGAVVS
jgi:hypothetical protein